jgi:hypothetical protein
MWNLIVAILSFVWPAFVVGGILCLFLGLEPFPYDYHEDRRFWELEQDYNETYYD